MEQPQKTFEEIMREEFALEDRAQKRPTIITIMCVLRFTGLILILIYALWLMQNPLIGRFAGQFTSNWYAYFMVVMAVANGIALMGIWQMKKWGAYSYIALLTFQLFFALSIGRLSAVAGIADFVCIFIVFFHLDKMR